MTSESPSSTEALVPPPDSAAEAPRRRRRRRLTAAGAAAVVLVLVAVLAVVVTRPDPAPVVIPDPGDVHAADSVVESMGVAVQLYQQSRRFDLLERTLGDLGVRHIRTGGRGEQFFAHVNQLHEDHGIKTLLVMDPREGYSGDDVVTEGLLPVLDAAEGVEGPNEWDINRDLEYDGQSWPEGVRAFADRMHDSIKGYRDEDPQVQEAVRALTVVSPSVADPDSTAELAGVRCDLASMHSYPGGELPDQDLTTKWMPAALQLCDGKGVVSTESGYCNTLTPEGCTEQGGVSERASAKYALRHYLEYFRAGVRRDYLYNLSTDDWDLFLDADGRRKPAFYAVRSLVDLLEDPGSTHHPTRFDVTVAATDEAGAAVDDVRHVVLQKRDGSYWLALWANTLSYPAGEECCDVETTRRVSVQLPRAMTATRYEPTFSGTSAVGATATSSTLQLDVPDHVVLLRLDEAPDAADPSTDASSGSSPAS
ncbi:hypothetical protein [Kineococcus indalonis]|uniref:hypothetical protein n=1 Tax=Kineococcus indalonis TaxID=2696566 RepID=UPI001411DE27|nr:hypothetical protein [Kineococcus indalonis]NAZ87180.1 hypothetical protein [Kineococcus indalonis]